MRDETIITHNELVKILEDAGYDVTTTEVDEYKNMTDDGYMGVEYVLTIFEDLSEDQEENPYKVK